MVVMKLEVKESSEKRSSRQLLPTPVCACVRVRVGWVKRSMLDRMRTCVKPQAGAETAHEKSQVLTTVPNQQQLDQHICEGERGSAACQSHS